MQAEDYLTRIVNLIDGKAQLSNLISLIKSKCETLEITNKHLKIESDQKLKYQNDYNELLKNQNPKKDTSKSRKGSID